jgi:hypothetical protein
MALHEVVGWGWFISMFVAYDKQCVARQCGIRYRGYFEASRNTMINIQRRG